MTLDKLQSIVMRLANAAPTRYWVHFNYPRQDPWQMAVKTSERPAQSGALHRQMNDLGFTWHEKFQLWVVERTDERGGPFRMDGPLEDN
jgi:hypothetical protein